MYWVNYDLIIEVRGMKIVSYYIVGTLTGVIYENICFFIEIV